MKKQNLTVKYQYHGSMNEWEKTFCNVKEKKDWEKTFKPFVKVKK